MIIALVGPYAVGKTTFVEHHYNNINGLESVSGDVRRKGHPPPFTKMACRNIELKLVALDEAVADDSKYYLVEGCRFWMGRSSKCLSVLADRYLGGVSIVAVKSSPSFLLDNINARRIEWGKDALIRPSDIMLTSIRQWDRYWLGRFNDVPHMPAHMFEIYSYDDWTKVKLLIDDYISRPSQDWYV